MTSKQKTSSVWPFFREDVGTPFATCTLCSSRIKRGKDGDRKNWSSKPMWTHLRSKHQTEFRNAAESREKAEQAVKKRKLAEAEKVKAESDSLIFKSIFVLLLGSRVCKFYIFVMVID